MKQSFLKKVFKTPEEWQIFQEMKKIVNGEFALEKNIKEEIMTTTDDIAYLLMVIIAKYEDFKHKSIKLDRP